MKTKQFTQMLVGTNLTCYLDSSVVEGEVVGESKNTFKIHTANGMRTVIKSACTFNANGAVVSGAQISKKPEDRFKGA